MTLLCQPFPMPEGRRAQAWRHQSAYRRPAHFHDEPEFNLVVRGTARFIVGHRRVSLTAGSLYWYPPGLDHYLEWASPDLELYVVGFQSALLEAYEREHQHVPRFTRPPQCLDAQTLRSCVDVLAQAPENVDECAVEQRLLQVLTTLSRLEARTHPTLGHRAAALLLEAPTLGRDELTRRLASNRGDVSRRFRSDQGLSLTEYKNRLHTLRLVALLDEGQESLTRAALDAGFGSYSRCHQVIRDLLGVAPRTLLDSRNRRVFADKLEPIGPHAVHEDAASDPLP